MPNKYTIVIIGAGVSGISAYIKLKSLYKDDDYTKIRIIEAGNPLSERLKRTTDNQNIINGWRSWFIF